MTDRHMNIYDHKAIEASKTLAETLIEEMEDYQSVLDIAENAHDIIERAHDRLEELLPSPKAPKYEDPISVTSNYTGETFPAGWLRFEKRNRDFPCENVDGFAGHDYIVPGFLPRMWVDNDLGPPRNGKKNQYICTLCALQIYSALPPVPDSIPA